MESLAPSTSLEAERMTVSARSANSNQSCVGVPRHALDERSKQSLTSICCLLTLSLTGSLAIEAREGRPKIVLHLVQRDIRESCEAK